MNMVQTTMTMLQPELENGWSRIVNYSNGTAACYNRQANLVLRLKSFKLENEMFSLKTEWTDYSGKQIHSKTHFLGRTPFDWQQAADSVAEVVACS